MPGKTKTQDQATAQAVDLNTEVMTIFDSIYCSQSAVDVGSNAGLSSKE